MRNIIFIKGSPGVGKSYLSKKLASTIKARKLAIIPIDDILHFDQRKLNEDKLIISIKNTATIVQSFLREDFDTIIEYTFDNPSHLEFLIDKIKYSLTERIPKSNLFIFHLSASYRDVEKRNQNRRDGSDPLSEKILKPLYLKCEKTAGIIKDEVIIDTSKITFGQLLKMIINKIT